MRKSSALLALVAALVFFPLAAHAGIADRLDSALHSGSVLAYVIVFAAGVLTSLTPCVYPLIPITLSIFGARGEAVSRARAISLALAYIGGIAAMYTSLGVGSALAGKAFGTFMASPYVIVPIAILFVAMSASMFGAFDMNLPPALADRLSRFGGAGYTGAFAMGLVGGIIAAPCTGPVLASVLAFVATSRSVLFGGSLLFVYALGMGLLFFILAATAASLPKSGAWMDSVKSIFGVVMIVAALYFLRNVVPPIHRYASWQPRFAFIHGGLALFGLAIGGIHLSFHDGATMVLRKALGVAGIVVGVFGLIAWSQTARPFQWEEGEPAALAKAKELHMPMLLDFSADWCGPCKEMEVKVFGDDRVRSALGRFVYGKVDCTLDDDAVTAVKEKYGAKTLPAVVVLGSDGKIAKVWNEEIGPDDLLAALKHVR